MMFRIAKQFMFSASHQLHGLPVDHPCGRIHGHNYTVEIILESDEVDGRGFVRDYGELSEIGDWIDQHLDHRHLNDMVAIPPTAENIALHIFYKFRLAFPEMEAVRVSETPKTWAEYSR